VRIVFVPCVVSIIIRKGFSPMFEHFFEPDSVAVIGASRTPGKVGYDILKNLIDSGFDGPLFPVNPNADKILGYDCYAALTDVGQPVDLAIVVLPSKVVLDVTEQCREAGVDSMIVISAGFKESGDQGAELEKRLADRCAEYGIRCIGPNCLGVISPPSNVNASFSATTPPPGNVAFFSQSGALGTAVLDWFAGASESSNLGISRFVSYGNKADVDESDLLLALGNDEETEVILGYVESINDGQKFMRIASEVTKKKPVIILKSGRTSAGAKAASSHTGSLAGSDAAYEAAFKQTGVIRARSATEFFDYVLAFSRQNPPEGRSVAIITNAGGPGILATDAIESTSLSLARLADKTESVLSENLPPGANIHNPVDVVGDARADRYKLAIGTVLDDEGVDGGLVILTPQTSTEVEDTARVIVEASGKSDKPLLSCFMGSLSTKKGVQILESGHVPNYDHPERAIGVMDAMATFKRWSKTPRGKSPQIKLDDQAIQKTLADAADAGMDELGEQHARAVVEAAGIALPGSLLASDENEAVEAASKLGYPVVMKIASQDILHKSDAGGVKVGLNNEEEVREAFRAITQSARSYSADARIDGVLVQEMVCGGAEVIVGLNRDPQFGPLLMFGMGGIYVELLKDVSFRVAPITEEDARQMIEEIQTSKMLKGFRGKKPGDIEALCDCLLRVSKLAVDYPQFAECDMNPLLVFEEGKGVMALDARFRIEHG
jgi:acetyltransferase